MIGNFSRNERLNFNYIFILSSVKKGTIILILTYSEITNGNVTSIVINTPTVLLYFVNTVSIATYVIDIHYGYTIVRIDGHMIDIVGWSSEVVTINTIYETTTRRTFFLKVYLTCLFIFRIYHQRISLQLRSRV